MKKKLLSVLSLSLIFALVFAVSASAVTPRWLYIGSITPGLDKYGDTYYTSVGCPSNVTRIDITLELYQKGLLGTYSKKATHNETVYGASGFVYGSYDLNESKTYRVDATVTVTTSSGQTETVTVSHTG